MFNLFNQSGCSRKFKTDQKYFLPRDSDKNDIQEVTGVFIVLPEPNILTNGDSTDEYDEGFINNITIRQLTSDTKVVLRKILCLGETFKQSEYVKSWKRTWIAGDDKIFLISFPINHGKNSKIYCL